MIVTYEDEIRHMQDTHEASIRLIESRKRQPSVQAVDLDHFLNECFIAMASVDGTVSMEDFSDFLKRAGAMGQQQLTLQDLQVLVFGSDEAARAAGRVNVLSITRFKNAMANLAKLRFAEEAEEDFQTLFQLWVETSLVSALHKSKFFGQPKAKSPPAETKNAREKKAVVPEESNNVICVQKYDEEAIAQALVAFVPKRESLQRILDHCQCWTMKTFDQA